MDKTIIIALMERIRTQVPEIRWIDLDMGQLQVSERPPIAYPACLLDMEYSSCEQLSREHQQVTVSIRLSIVADGIGTTHTGTPTYIREKALSVMNVLQRLHTALQWWDNDRMWMPITRSSVRPERRNDGLKVYNAVYQLRYIDQQDSQESTTTTSSATAGAALRPLASLAVAGSGSPLDPTGRSKSSAPRQKTPDL